MASFEFQPYENRSLGAILELMQGGARARAQAARQSGDARARAMEIRGQIGAQLGRDLGGIASGALQQYGQYKAEAPRREMEQLQLQSARNDAQGQEAEQQVSGALRQLFSGEQPPAPEQIMQVAGPERGLKIVQGLKALQGDAAKEFGSQQTVVRDVLAGMEALPPDMRAEYYPQVRQTLLGKGVIQPGDAPEQYDEAWFQTARNYGKSAEKPEAGFTLSEGQTRYGPDGKPIASIAAAPKEAKLHPVTVNENGRPVRKMFTEDQLRQGVQEYREPKSTSEGRFWVMRDGKPVRVTESQYRLGDAPASNREQGRPVTSGDAGRIAEIDTSLDDLKVLRETLTQTQDSTGTRAKVGAVLPNAITELTGWGEDAKKRQGVIDRVKQVIGKALEGGVLRKEDEIKYEKILPTIGDTQAVAAAKLDGLERALVQRRSTFIDALSDANYDTTKYRERPARVPSDARSAAVSDAEKRAQELINKYRPGGGQ